MTRHRRSDDFNEYLADELRNPEFAAVFEEEKEKIDLAVQILKFRQRAGLSQRELARRIGTSQSVIARMESPEYGGYSIRMLRRIAAALGTRLQIEFRPIQSSTPPRAPSTARRSRVEA